jgi:hypothetical protein
MLAPSPTTPGDKVWNSYSPIHFEKQAFAHKCVRYFTSDNTSAFALSLRSCRPIAIELQRLHENKIQLGFEQRKHSISDNMRAVPQHAHLVARQHTPADNEMLTPSGPRKLSEKQMTVRN